MQDPLTGILNRKYFDIKLAEETALAMTVGQDLCLIMSDIDHFKQFNDTFGHQVGDEVLKVTTRVLTNGIKGRDTAARCGGEEFCVILCRAPAWPTLSPWPKAFAKPWRKKNSRRAITARPS
ncbi:MAG: GGDEF domain-containing protein, partial [Alphaproteobacteria bacterium]